MVKATVFYFSLTASVAVGLAAIIYIIVDKTTYCRTGSPKPNTAVSYDDGVVICFPGYVFSDGNTSHKLTCDSPPRWNWDAVPECIKVNEAVSWKCPVQSDEMELLGEVLIFQSEPSLPIRVQGEIQGLNSSTIQVVDILDANKTCHITNQLGSYDMQGGTVIEGNALRIDETLVHPMLINETFQFFIRAIGSQHVQEQSVKSYDGVAVFILEQNKKTIGVFSANSV